MKVSDLNPIPAFDVGGTDLAIPFRTSRGTRYLLGDTFGGRQPAVGGPNWRSPMYLRGDKDIDLSRPIRFTSAARGAGQLWDYAHDNPVFSTVLPCDGIEINGRIYVWVMVTKGLGNEQWCEIWWTDDDGEHWTNSDVKWSTGAFGGMRVMITFEKDPHSDWVYAMSTGGLARNKGLLLWRFHKTKITDPNAWEGWGWNGKDWGWGRSPSDVLHGWKFGEICLRHIQGNWVFSAFDAGSYCAVVKVLKSPTDDLHAAPTYRPVHGNPTPGADHVPRLYGCYVHPDSKLGKQGGVGLIVSEWAVGGNPYRAMQYTVDQAIPPVNPIIEEDIPMAGPEDVVNILKNEADRVLIHAGRREADGKESSFFTGSMRDMLKNVAFEMTLWIPSRHPDQTDWDAKDTVLGQAARAAGGVKAMWPIIKTLPERLDRIEQTLKDLR